MSDRPSNKTNLAKNAVNKAAEIYVSSQIDNAENLEIEIDTQPERLLQGKVDSMSIKGQKVTWHELKIAQLDLNLDNLEIELLPTILGQVKLTKPGNIQAKIILNKNDCDRLLNSKYAKTLLQKLSICVGEKTYIWNLENAKCYLADNGKITLNSQLKLSFESETKIVDFEITVRVCQQGQEIMFEGGKYLNKSSLSLTITAAIINKVTDLLYLRHFSNSYFAFEIKQIEIIDKHLILWSNIQMYQIPDSLKAPIESIASEINH